MGKEVEDLTGRKFGRWTVLGRAEDHIDKHGHRHKRWHCRCDCELHTEKDVLQAGLKNGNSTSCGCWHREVTRARGTKHGLSGTRIKRIYYNMHSRCENPNTPKFKNHGGRGIKICDEWSGEDGLVNFYNWAMANGYDEKLTLDRMDNDGDYEPSNCRWVDYHTQNLNHRRNKLVTIDGVTKTVTEWSEEYGIHRNTFDYRLSHGVTGKDLLAPLKKYDGCSSGFTGVHYRSDNGKWRTTVSKDGKTYNFGSHENLEDAVYARLNGELEIYDEFISDVGNVIKTLEELKTKEGM